MKTLIRLSVLTLLTGTAGISYPENASQPQEQRADREVAITGCLTKGGAAGVFVISDKEGRKTEFIGSNELEQYANQLVRLTGTVVDRDGKPTFQPKAVERISPSCEAR